MGLDACVFVGQEDVGDPRTVCARLGNVSLIGGLLSEVRDTGQNFPILLDRVLYEGAHNGDLLDASDLSCLAEELSRLKQRSRISKQLSEVIAQLEALTAAAEKFRKPIVFV